MIDILEDTTTGAWVAIADRNDGYHSKAASIYPTLLRTNKRLVTSNLVVAESYVIILHELGHKEAVSFLEKIKASPRIFTIYSDEQIESVAEGLLRKYSDQDFSYTDAVSFAIMRRYEIKKSFAFDSHFFAAGFVNIP